METLNPNKFEEQVASFYEQIKEIESQIKVIGLQAKDECYEILSKNPKGNCVLFSPYSRDVLFTGDYTIWAVGAFDGTLQLKAYEDEYDPSPDDKFRPLCYKDKEGNDRLFYSDLDLIRVYKSVVNNLDNAMPLEEAKQYYPKYSDDDNDWKMVKK